jgi:hypothetical protein
MAFTGKSTALYGVDVMFEIQPMGAADVQKVAGRILLRTLTEEALRLEHAARRDGTRFSYPDRTSAPSRPGAAPTNLDPVQPPDYLAVRHPTTIGSSIVGEVTGCRQLHDQLLDALNREQPDLFPMWEQAKPSAFACKPARFATAVRNLTTLAEGVSGSALRAGMNSLLGDGVRLRFRRDGLFSNDYYTLHLTGQLSGRSHRGSTTTIRAVDIAGHTNPLMSTFDRTAKLRIGPELRGAGTVPGFGKLSGGLEAKRGWSSGFRGGYGNSVTAYSLSFFPDGVEIFDHTISYAAHLEHYNRPRGWRRTLLSWPFAGGWQFTESQSRSLLEDQPTSGGVTLWTPQQRSWRPDPSQPLVAPPEHPLPVSTDVAPARARQILSAQRPAQLSRPFHLEALNHRPELVLQRTRRLLSELSGGVAMMTNNGTPVGQAMADQLSAEMLKGHSLRLTGPGGLLVHGPIGFGTYRDWYWSAQVRATPKNWQLIDIVDGATVEEYYAGGSSSSITAVSSQGWDATATLGGTLSGQAAHSPAAGNLNAAWRFLQRSTTTTETIAITGNHERNLSGVGRYAVLKADLAYTILAQARWHNLIADTLPGSMRPALRELTDGFTIPHGIYLLMHEAHAREVGLLGSIAPPTALPGSASWSAPEYLSHGLGLSVLA